MASLASTAAVKLAVERDASVPAKLTGYACVADGCKCAETLFRESTVCGSCLRPPSGNGAVITAKINVHHVYQCSSGGS